MYYYFDSGKWNNKMLPLAAEYLQYLGTKNKSSEVISKVLQTGFQLQCKCR
jgi:hypothetical protein